MGTNYYLMEDVCPACGRSGETLHIGKSSAGWCFSLHVIPEEGLNSLDDWRRRWRGAPTEIEDECGNPVTRKEMEQIITERKWKDSRTPDLDWQLENFAKPGPKGLVRHRIMDRCIGHGEGTWDLIEGEFG